jgi:hypothetical protein
MSHCDKPARRNRGFHGNAGCRVIRKFAQGFFVREGSLADGAAEQIFFPSHVGLFCATSLNCALKFIVRSGLTMDSMPAGDVSLYGVMDYSFYPECQFDFQAVSPRLRSFDAL